MSDNNIYEYHIADYSWQLQLPVALNIQEDYKVFFDGPIATEKTKLSDSVNFVKFERVESLNPVPEGAYFTDHCYYASTGSEKIVFRCPTTNNRNIPTAEIHFQTDGNVHYKFLDAEQIRLSTTFGLINALNLEYLMLSHSALLLHSCLLRYQDEAILFSAPSGVGKSTQGNLWIKYRGADVLDGDRSGIYQKDGQWRATGLPFAGTSGIYRNENVPIRAIVYLAQGPENQISRLNGVQAFRLLYPQIHIHHWEADFVAKASDLLISLLSEVPVYFLSCRPDEGAVETLEKQLLSV